LSNTQQLWPLATKYGLVVNLKTAKAFGSTDRAASSLDHLVAAALRDCGRLYDRYGHERT
jgi:hypothetical protein